MRGIEDLGVECETQQLVETQYWPSFHEDANANNSTAAPAAGGRVVAQSASSPAIAHPPPQPSWWEQTNWFRVNQAREDAARREEQRLALGVDLHRMDDDAPPRRSAERTTRGGMITYSSAPLGVSHPLHDDDDAPVPYGGFDDNDGSVLGTRYTDKASRGIGKTIDGDIAMSLLLVPAPASEKDALAAAPGGADVFCRFITSSKRSAAVTASIVEPTVVEPVPAIPSPQIVVPQQQPQQKKVAPATVEVTSLFARGSCPTIATLASQKSVTKSASAAASHLPQKTLVKSRAATKLHLQCLLGYDASVKRSVHELILLPLLHSDLYTKLGVQPAHGVILTGAHGSGKTHLVRSIINELGSKIYVQSIDCAHLLTELQHDLVSHKASDPKNLESSIGIQNSGAGLGAPKEEGDDTISKLFAQCRKNAPALLFLDEIDLLTSTKASDEQPIISKIRALLRLNLDRLYDSNASGIVIIGTTSSPEKIDTSFLRAGRFSKTLVLNKPDEQGRYEILMKECKEMKMEFVNGEEWERDDQNVSRKKIDPSLSTKDQLRSSFFHSLSQHTYGYLSSDLIQLCQEAGMVCIREFLVKKGMDEHEEYDDEKMKDDTPIDHSITPVPEFKLTPAEYAQLRITPSHFRTALNFVRPASNRSFGNVDSSSDAKPMKWSDIGGVSEIKNVLIETIQQPLLYPHVYAKYGIAQGGGLLLYGPPGTGKTLMARSIAKHAGASFISIKGPELLSSYLGESESNIRQLFHRARAASPCIIFFDEIDSIGLRRGQQSDATCDRILNQLLTEMDGRIMGGGEEYEEEKKVKKVEASQTTAAKDAGEIDAKKDGEQDNTEKKENTNAKPSTSPRRVKSITSSSSSPPIIFIIGATNRPDLLDPALLRPGRFDHLVYCGLPDEQSRFDIMKKCLKNTPVEEESVTDEFLKDLAAKATNLSGADLAAMCNSARKKAITDYLKKQKQQKQSVNEKPASKFTPITLSSCDHVTSAHLTRAYTEITPSISEELIERYRLFQEQMKRGGDVQVVNDVKEEGMMGVRRGMDETASMMSDDDIATSPTTSTVSASSSSSSSSSTIASTDLKSLRDSFRSTIMAKLATIPDSAVNPQAAMNRILADLLKETNQNSWIVPTTTGASATSSSSSSSNNNSLANDEPVSLASSMMEDDSTDMQARRRKVGGRER